MRNRLCVKCGREFTPATEDEKLCGDCREKALKKTTLTARICPTCGTPFFGHGNAKYCQDCRLDSRRRSAAKYEKGGPSRPLGSVDKCIACGKEYIVKSGAQKYCPDCATQAIKDSHRQRKNEKMAEYRKKYIRPTTRSVYTCRVCGKKFESIHQEIFCSPECRKKYQAAYRKEYYKNYPKK